MHAANVAATRKADATWNAVVHKSCQPKSTHGFLGGGAAGALSRHPFNRSAPQIASTAFRNSRSARTLAGTSAHR